MPPSPTASAGDKLDQLRRRAAAARDRASWCAEQAARHAAMIPMTSGVIRASHLRLRDVNRRAEARQRTSAECFDLVLRRLESNRMATQVMEPEPALMAAVARQLGVPAAVAALGARNRPAAVAASDSVARAAHDLECVLAEGPATEAAGGCFVMAGGRQLRDRWPRYGPAAAELGIGAVWATPLGPADVRIGALCAYGPDAAPLTGIATATRLMGVALTELLLGVTRQTRSADGLAALGFTGILASQPVVHQAAGMVSVLYGCGVDDALDVLAARAFADGRPMPEVARQVIDEQPAWPEAPDTY